jgi:hypothetical protein
MHIACKTGALMRKFAFRENKTTMLMWCEERFGVYILGLIKALRIVIIYLLPPLPIHPTHSTYPPE